MKRFTCFVILYLFLIPFSSLSQTNLQMPPNSVNSRFPGEGTFVHNIVNPGLSIIGFDNGGDDSFGHGLKQILIQVYDSTNFEQKELFKDILSKSHITIESTPSSATEIRDNSQILQFLAFEVLCSYILEQNGISASVSNAPPYSIEIDNHTNALNRFKSAINTLVNNNTLTSPGDDYVHNTVTFENIARALDLYLALENAYAEWNEVEYNNSNSNVLFNQSERFAFIDRLHEDLYKLKHDHIQKSHGLGINEDEVEPGNRPLKGHISVGYGALLAYTSAGFSIGSFVNDAIIRGSAYSNNERTRYWMYQSQNGDRMWAEGPYYFNFALTDVIPFWHALRANNLLGTTSDPFTNSWFLNPVEWLADISTPDGRTPPLDDGNKFPIYNAQLLRWSSQYGDTNISKKFASVFQNSGQAKSNLNLLIELAIPKSSASTPINYEHNIAGEPLIVRMTPTGTNDLHYILLNGETGNRTNRGEGHEQPDQKLAKFIYPSINTSGAAVQ